MPPGHAQLEVLEVLDRADRLLGMDDVRAVVDAVDVDTGPAWRRSRAPPAGRPCCRRRCPTRAGSAGPSGTTTGTPSPASCRPSTRVNEFIASSTPFFTPSSSSKSPTTSFAANGLNSSSPPVFSLIVLHQALNVARPTPAGQEVCTFHVVVWAAALRMKGAPTTAVPAAAPPCAGTCGARAISLATYALLLGNCSKDAFLLQRSASAHDYHAHPCCKLKEA